ncbi:MAG: hypothetical protein ACRDCE_17205 [Cetobacterium sp.]|uniref:hypothetical protein n=1 Tax=Cetobacterium sp. TaxID=2071632 RepID=UPI003EE4655E
MFKFTGKNIWKTLRKMSEDLKAEHEELKDKKNKLNEKLDEVNHDIHSNRTAMKKLEELMK